MKLRSFLTQSFLTLTLAAVAAGGVLALVLPGRATAQREPTMVISPPSGPCDATIEVTGQDFPPSTAIRLDMGVPSGDGTMGKLASLISDPSGRFAVSVRVGQLGCDAAVLDDTGRLWIFADLEERVIDPGEGIPPILTRTAYTATTTQVAPQPTLTLSPSSGPCDATIQVSGSGFPVPSAPFQDEVWLYLVEPGTADVNADSLTWASVDQDGTFSEWVGLRQGGCGAAALESQAGQPSGHLVIAATLSQAALQPGDRIPDIIATAQYEYATAAPRVPTEALTISPASGPCDATVEVTGSGFQGGMAVVLKLASASGEFGLGPLASAVAGDDGEFEAEFSFGELGCSTAELIRQYSSGAELVVGSFPAVYPRRRLPARQTLSLWCGTPSRQPLSPQFPRLAPCPPLAADQATRQHPCHGCRSQAARQPSASY